MCLVLLEGQLVLPRCLCVTSLSFAAPACLSKFKSRAAFARSGASVCKFPLPPPPRPQPRQACFALGARVSKDQGAQVVDPSCAHMIKEPEKCGEQFPGRQAEDRLLDLWLHTLPHLGAFDPEDLWPLRPAGGPSRLPGRACVSLSPAQQQRVRSLHSERSGAQ